MSTVWVAGREVHTHIYPTHVVVPKPCRARGCIIRGVDNKCQTRERRGAERALAVVVVVETKSEMVVVWIW
jgi:hypothetical protein